MEEEEVAEEKCRRRRIPSRLGRPLRHTRAVFLSGHTRRGGAAARALKQLPCGGRQLLGTRLRISILLSSRGPPISILLSSRGLPQPAAPATVAVVTRTAGDVRVHSGTPFPPLIPGDRGLGGGQDGGARQRRLQLLAGTWVFSPQQLLKGPQRGTKRTTAPPEAGSRLFPSRARSHTETSPGGTTSGKSQTIPA